MRGRDSRWRRAMEAEAVAAECAPLEWLDGCHFEGGQGAGWVEDLQGPGGDEAEHGKERNGDRLAHGQFSVGLSMRSMTRTSMGAWAGTSLMPRVFSSAMVSDGASGALSAAASPSGAHVRSVTSKQR